MSLLLNFINIKKIPSSMGEIFPQMKLYRAQYAIKMLSYNTSKRKPVRDKELFPCFTLYQEG